MTFSHAHDFVLHRASIGIDVNLHSASSCFVTLQ
jgi:hypothetical protein